MSGHEQKNEDPSGAGLRTGLRFSRFFLGLLLGAAAVYFAARELSWPDIAAALTGIRPGWLAAAIGLAFFGQTIKAVRWRLLLAAEPDPPSLLTAWVYHLSGQLGNILVPGPAGDVGRILVVGRRGQGRMFTLGTVALEKIFDLIAYGILAAVLILRVPLPEWAAGSAGGLAALAVLAVVALAAAIRYRSRLAGPVRKLLAPLPLRWRERTEAGLRAAAAALTAVGGRSTAVKLAGATALIWVESVLINHFMSLAFGLTLPLSASALLLLVLQAGVSTNVVPGTVGLFEFLCVQTLALYGVPRQAAFSLGIVLHGVILVPLVTAALVGVLGGFRRR